MRVKFLANSIKLIFSQTLLTPKFNLKLKILNLKYFKEHCGNFSFSMNQPCYSRFSQSLSPDPFTFR